MTDEVPAPFSNPLAAVREVIDDAVAVPARVEEAPPPPTLGSLWRGEAAGPPPEPPPAQDHGGGRALVPAAGLPEDCPVTPLGVQGALYWYLDALNQLRDVPAKDHNKNVIRSLYGRHLGELRAHFPRHNKNAEIIGWDGEDAAETLMAACSRKGVWDVQGRVRGPGGWLGEHGELIFHCGDIVVQGASGTSAECAARPDQIGRFVYPASAALPQPVERAVAGEAGPAGQLLELLKTWHWARDETDAILLLGWIGAALLGGALDWRPMLWLTGDKATGKSTLQKLLKYVLQDGLLSVTDPTEAGVRQTLAHASLPVAIDEAEAEEDNRTLGKIVRLARQAASGSIVARGGSDHKGHTFTVRSAFLLSSINVPPLQSQDLSRITLMDLRELRAAKGGALPELRLDPAAIGEIGRGLKRRLLMGWPRFAVTLETWRQQLAAGGAHAARGADQFGTLLACADLLLFDGPPDPDTLDAWTADLGAKAIAARTDDAADHERMVRHLLSSILDVYRGNKRVTVAGAVMAAAKRETVDPVDTPEGAQAALQTYGIKVHELGQGEAAGDGAAVQFLALANNHQGLAHLFERTHWAARSGAVGGWVQACMRVLDARAGNLRFEGVATRCWLLPLDAVFGEGDVAV